METLKPDALKFGMIESMPDSTGMSPEEIYCAGINAGREWGKIEGYVSGFKDGLKVAARSMAHHVRNPLTGLTSFVEYVIRKGFIPHNFTVRNTNLVESLQRNTRLTTESLDMVIDSLTSEQIRLIRNSEVIVDLGPQFNEATEPVQPEKVAS